MAVKGGPNIVTQGLVLDLDSGNKKSIPLDPTVNLVPNPNNPFLWGNGGGVAITASNVVAPDGTLTANTIYSLTNAAWFAYTTTIGATTGSQYTTSYYIKMLTGSTFNAEWGGAHGGNRTNFVFNTNTGTFSNVSTASGETYGAEQSTNGFWRIYYSSTLNAGTTPYYFPQLSTGASQSFALWGVQIERNKYATPLVSGSRTAWRNLTTTSQTASLVAASSTSSIPQFRSLGDGLLTFDGIGSYAEITGSAAAVASAFTLSAWVNTKGNTGWQGLIVKSRESFPWYGLWLLNTTPVLANNGTNLYATSTVTANTWNNVVGTFDGANLRIYINGVFNTTTTSSIASEPTRNIAIGRALGVSEFLTGSMAVAQIYNRPLTAEEVLQNYNAQKTRFGL